MPHPLPGERVLMPAMGSNVLIEIADVPEEQPLAADEGVLIIVDQYGEEHLIESDGDDWVVSDPRALSPDGLNLWLERVYASPKF